MKKYSTMISFDPKSNEICIDLIENGYCYTDNFIRIPVEGGKAARYAALDTAEYIARCIELRLNA